jgi:hypothetical protein
MNYYCEICNYLTVHRNKIHYHHIKPVELGGSDWAYNRVYLCPTCHCLVYIPESLTGIHSIKCDDSIKILKWIMSTDGRVLHYINKFNEEVYSLTHNSI